MNTSSSWYSVSNTPVHLQFWISMYSILSFLLAIDSDQCRLGSLHAVVPDVRDSNRYISSHPCHQQSPRGWTLCCHGNHHQIVSAIRYHISISMFLSQCKPLLIVTNVSSVLKPWLSYEGTNVGHFFYVMMLFLIFEC